MKNLLLVIALFTLQAQAASVHCTTVATRTSDYFPDMDVDFDANLADLATLKNVKVSVPGDSFEADVLKADTSYRPHRGNSGLRFGFTLQPETDTFDGIVHGMILPLQVSAGTKTFHATALSSTDSYHDGIVSYFAMSCSVK